MIVFVISKWNEDGQYVEIWESWRQIYTQAYQPGHHQNVLIEEFETCGGFDYKKKIFL